MAVYGGGREKKKGKAVISSDGEGVIWGYEINKRRWIIPEVNG